MEKAWVWYEIYMSKRTRFYTACQQLNLVGSTAITIPSAIFRITRDLTARERARK
jgi:hypothetical protein